MDGRRVGETIAVVISTAETIGEAIVTSLGGTVEIGTAGAASPVAIPATAVGVVVTAHGAIGINNFIIESKKLGSGGSSGSGPTTGNSGAGAQSPSGGSRLKPDPKAQGEHSVFEVDKTTGKTKKYETYKPQSNPKNPNPWESVKRFDQAGGDSHFNKVTGKDVPTPHVHDPSVDGGVRTANPGEIPK
jgi:hypothetical protein